MDGPRLSRRELLAAGAAGGVALGLPGSVHARTSPAQSGGIDFTMLAPGDGWPGWRCPGVANLRRSDGAGLLEAGSDVFPCDARPVAFAVDRRFRDSEITAVVDAAGAGAGVVLRRVGPRDYYAAIYDDERAALVLIRRSPAGGGGAARGPPGPPRGPPPFSLRPRGR